MSMSQLIEQPEKGEKKPASDEPKRAANDQKKKSSNKVICYHCRKEGHYKSQCPQLKSTVAAVTQGDGSSAATAPENLEFTPSLSRVYAEDLSVGESQDAEIKPLQAIVEAHEFFNKRAWGRNVQAATQKFSQIFEQNKEMILPVKVAGQSTEALVDTGATRTCIGMSFVKQTSMKVEGTAFNAR